MLLRTYKRVPEALAVCRLSASSANPRITSMYVCTYALVLDGSQIYAPATTMATATARRLG